VLVVLPSAAPELPEEMKDVQLPKSVDRKANSASLIISSHSSGQFRTFAGLPLGNSVPRLVALSALGILLRFIKIAKKEILLINKQ
jgi:hypothetical protein